MINLKSYKKYYRCEDWTVEQIARAFKGGDDQGQRVIIPLFQRGKVWDNDDKLELIKSLRNGFPIGSMLFAELGEKVYSVVDGLQRGSTICDYIYHPTSCENLDKIDDSVLNEIRLILFPDNQSTTVNKAINDKIIEYFSRKESFDDISINKLITILIEDFPNDEIEPYKTSKKLADILEPWFKTYKEYYDKIAKAEIPVVVYSGDENYLNAIFRKINEQGVELTDYEIYASSWQQYRKTAPEEIVNYVLKKYDVLLMEGYELQDYSSEKLRQTKELQPFEFLFGLGKWLSREYGLWLKTKSKYKDDEICEIGFEIVNICLNAKKEDVADLDKKLKDINFTTLFRRIKEAINFVIKSVQPVSAFKGNKRKIKYLHGQRQVLSMIGYVFREMYDSSDLDKKKDSWKAIQSKLSQNLLHHYVYDIIDKYWNEGSDKPYSAIKERKYSIEISKNAWNSLLNNYFENSLQQADTCKKVQAPTIQDQIILNCVYLDLFTANDQLGNKNFDIEHLATKKLMQQHLKNTGLAGLPISSIANQCYLPQFGNRSKHEKTIYQQYGKDQNLIMNIEKKYSFTTKEGLEWIELPYETNDQKELKADYENFLRTRFDIMLKKFLNSLNIVPIEDWEKILRSKPDSSTQTINTLIRNETSVAGVYDLAQIEVDLSGSALETVIYNGEKVSLTKWKDLLNFICEAAYSLNSTRFDLIVKNNEVHKATSKLNAKGKDPIITDNVNLIIEAKQIKGTNYFTEGCISGERARFYSKQIADIFGFTDKIQIVVRDR